VRRGDVFQARLNPTVGSEQAGQRPVIIVSRNAINAHSPVVIAVPVTGSENCPKVYPSQVVLERGAGGLRKNSVALGEQVRAISKRLLLTHLGALDANDLKRLDTALKIALDLP